MAYVLLNRVGNNICHWTGLSTDVKPTTGGQGSTFYEEDTTTPYVYGGSGWVVDTRRSSGGASDPASAIHAADAKATPADLDEFGLVNSAGAVWTLVKTTGAQIKAWLKAYLDGFYSALGHTHAYLSAETDPIVGAINGIVQADGAGNISAATAGTAYALPLTGVLIDEHYESSPINIVAGENLAEKESVFQGPDSKWWKFTGALPADWVADTVYAVGDMVKLSTWASLDNANNVYLLFCTAVAGDAKSDPAVEPVIGASGVGDTIVDDQVTWTIIDANSYRARAFTLDTINAAATGPALFGGFVRSDASFSFTPGATIYADPATPGALTEDRPSTADQISQIVGFVHTASGSTILFDFSHPTRVVT